MRTMSHAPNPSAIMVIASTSASAVAPPMGDGSLKSVSNTVHRRWRRSVRLVRRRSGFSLRRSDTRSAVVIRHVRSHRRQLQVKRTDPPRIVVSGTTLPTASQNLHAAGSRNLTCLYTPAERPSKKTASASDRSHARNPSNRRR